jgi:hypothetical protein
MAIRPTTPLLPLPSGTEKAYRRQRFPDHGSDEPVGWPPWHQDEPEFAGYTFERCEFGSRLADIGFRDCRFEKCTFHSYVRSAEFMRCVFVDCELDYCAIVSTKLKFCRFEGCTFTGAAILRCDLYRADFRRGNVFQRARLGLVSLSRGDVRGAGELRRVCFPPFQDRGELAPGIQEPQQAPSEYEAVRSLRTEVALPLIQEDPAQYEELLVNTDLTRPVDDTLARRLIEISDVYRMLSGVWMSAAAYDDGAWAYRQSRKYTRASLAPLFRRSAAAARKVPMVRREKGFRRAGLWAGLSLADPLCGFGTRLRGILVALVALVAGFAVLSARGWGLAAALETLLGIALLGLLGFVLANKLRFS